VVCYKRVDGDTVQFGEFGEPDAAERLRKWAVEASRGIIEELTVVKRKRLVEVSCSACFSGAGREETGLRDGANGSSADGRWSICSRGARPKGSS
jgi:hypothetical protein